MCLYVCNRGKMRNPLKIGQKIILKKDGFTYEYIIKDIAGYGASCIVYEATYFDTYKIEHLVRIKELYPIGMYIERDADFSLIVKNVNCNIFLYKKWKIIMYKKSTLKNYS